MRRKPLIFAELCAGSASVTAGLLGGERAKPPISYMGAKTGIRAWILEALGLRVGQGADAVLLCEPGPWAPVWALLSQPGGPEQVAAHIRGWQVEGAANPRALWDRLKAEGWADLRGAEGVGRWLLCADWAFRRGHPNSSFIGESSGKKRNLSAGTLATRTEAVARWMLACKWSFSEKGPQHGYGGPGCEVRTYDSGWTTEKRDTAIGIPRFTGQIEACGKWLSSAPFAVYQGSAMDLYPPADASDWVTYLDPPYVGTSGYQSEFPRAQVIEVALRWHNAGATVAISEAVPIDIPGWYHVNLSNARRGNKRTFSKQQEEYLTMNRPPHRVPGEQLGMFGGER